MSCVYGMDGVRVSDLHGHQLRRQRAIAQNQCGGFTSLEVVYIVFGHYMRPYRRRMGDPHRRVLRGEQLLVAQEGAVFCDRPLGTRGELPVAWTGFIDVALLVHPQCA